MPVTEYGITIRRKINIIKAATVGEINEDCAFVVKGEEPAYLVTDKGNTFLITGDCITFLVTKEMAGALEREDISEFIITDQGNAFAVSGKGDMLLIVPQGTVFGNTNEISKYIVTKGATSFLVNKENNEGEESIAGSRKGKISGRGVGFVSPTWYGEAVSNIHPLFKWLLVIINALLRLR